jgi:hypothetical protein
LSQITATDIGQQTTDAGDEQQVQGDAPDWCAHLSLRVVRSCCSMSITSSNCLRISSVKRLPRPADRAAVIAAGALQIDHRLRVVGPFLLQRLQAVQTVGLGRVVAGQRAGFEAT